MGKRGETGETGHILTLPHELYQPRCCKLVIAVPFMPIILNTLNVSELTHGGHCEQAC